MGLLTYQRWGLVEMNEEAAFLTSTESVYIPLLLTKNLTKSTVFTVFLKCIFHFLLYYVGQVQIMYHVECKTSSILIFIIQKHKTQYKKIYCQTERAADIMKWTKQLFNKAELTGTKIG